VGRIDKNTKRTGPNCVNFNCNLETTKSSLSPSVDHPIHNHINFAAWHVTLLIHLTCMYYWGLRIMKKPPTPKAKFVDPMLTILITSLFIYFLFIFLVFGLVSDQHQLLYIDDEKQRKIALRYCFGSWIWVLAWFHSYIIITLYYSLLILITKICNCRQYYRAASFPRFIEETRMTFSKVYI